MLETTTRPVAPETVSPIKPSEAIRLGCLLAPVQAFGSVGVGDAACALGAMYLGFGEDLGSSTWSLDTRHWFEVICALGCPVAACRYGPAEAHLATPAHLNDDHRWTREQIADWLESEGF